MRGKVTVNINTARLENKLARLAVLRQQGLRDTLEMGAKRFIQLAVRNTMPMILRESPSTARQQWTDRVTTYFSQHRVTKAGYMKDSELNRLLRQKKRQLGREAGGWNAAAEKLGAKVPAWVRRHGTSEGSCDIIVRDGKASIRMRNSVPYNQEMTRRRAEYVLASVERGLDGNIRALKRKIIRSVK